MTDEEIQQLEDRVVKRAVAEIFAQLKLVPPEEIPNDDDELQARDAAANRRSE